MISKFRISVLTMVLTIVALTVQAQPDRGQGRRGADPALTAERQTQHMTKQMALSEDQAAKIKAVNLEYAQKVQAIRKESATDREALHQQMKTLREEQSNAIKQHLTDEQVQQWDALKAKRQSRGVHQKGHPNHPRFDKKPTKAQSGKAVRKADAKKIADRQTARLNDQLNLTEEQSAQATRIYTDYATKMAAVRESATDRTQMGQELKTLRNQQQEAINTILTEEQAAKWAKLKTERRVARKQRIEQQNKG